jgi:hypothetical protein
MSPKGIPGARNDTMRYTTLMALSLCMLSSNAVAREHQRIKIQVLETRTSERAYTYTTPGQAGTSNTTCSSNGTGTMDASTYGNNTYGTLNSNTQTNCSTTSTPATPPRTNTNYIQQEHVSAILPNGAHVTLWCQAGFRKCYELQPGYYDAEITGGSTVQVFVIDLQGKEHKVEYRSVAGS